jgi:Tol biopolymer transport system component
MARALIGFTRSLVFILAFAAAAQVPEIFAPGVISGPAHDSAPAFTPDGHAVYFTRNNASASTILVSRLRGGRWTPPELAPFSGEWNDMEPAMAPDGSHLVFVSSRPTASGAKPIDGFFNGKAWPGQGGNLWRVDRRGSSWSAPARLSEVVNGSASTFAPSIARDGSLYFMRPDQSSGKFRLFRSQSRESGFDPPVPLPFSTGAFTDVDPAVAPDESFLVFGSGRPPARSMDLFIVYRSNGQWGEPRHLGDEVNSAGSDAEARLSPDAKTLYFSSERVMPVVFPRSAASAQTDLLRIQAWDNGLYNVWMIPLERWLPGESPRVP